MTSNGVESGRDALLSLAERAQVTDDKEKHALQHALHLLDQDAKRAAKAAFEKESIEPVLAALESRESERAVEAARAYLKSVAESAPAALVLAAAQSLRLGQGEFVESPRAVSLVDLLLFATSPDRGGEAVDSFIAQMVLGGLDYLRDAELDGFKAALLARGYAEEEARQKHEAAVAWRARHIDAPMHASMVREMLELLNRKYADGGASLVSAVRALVDQRDHFSALRDEHLRSEFVLNKKVGELLDRLGKE